ncbi:hypothetical protein [Rhodovulum strictum]|uniref:Uncharacterized protein n=1 Tax=Rhodovulum strictum TaxID=58314 RepID=A0A844B551_9RHOB|nr:hypothetical protein [Rhodovulum strictum]MRH21496.1 hypothetical protein [Rhodovulum strictum]
MTTENAPRESLTNFSVRVDDTYHALRAFALLLDKATEYAPDEISGTIAYGVSHLLSRQLDDLQDINTGVSDLIARVKAAERAAPPAGPQHRTWEAMRAACLADGERPAWHDLDLIATRACVHRDEAARVLFVLTGEDHAGADYRAWDGHPAEGLPAHLLARTIHRTLSQCDLWGRVSTATGLELDQVKDVLNAMLDALPHRADARGQIAEMTANAKAEADMHARVAARDQDDATPAESEPEAAPATDALDRLREADLGQIARDTNLKEDTVKRVVARLLADPGGTATRAALG